MQRARHVYTGRIAVKAGEGAITRPQIRADAAQKKVERHTAPLPDLAPSFDTDVPGDLSLLRQAAQSVDRPRGLVRNQPGDRKAPIFWDHARRNRERRGPRLEVTIVKDAALSSRWRSRGESLVYVRSARSGLREEERPAEVNAVIID